VSTVDNRLKYCWPKVIYCSYLLYMSIKWT